MFHNFHFEQLNQLTVITLTARAHTHEAVPPTCRRAVFARPQHSLTTADVQYLLPGWSRDRDLDRERAWRRDRLWLTLWSAASTEHSGQKASHTSTTEGANFYHVHSTLDREHPHTVKGRARHFEEYFHLAFMVSIWDDQHFCLAFLRNVSYEGKNPRMSLLAIKSVASVKPQLLMLTLFFAKICKMLALGEL